jgi:hypothetical protein
MYLHSREKYIVDIGLRNRIDDLYGRNAMKRPLN